MKTFTVTGICFAPEHFTIHVHAESELEAKELVKRMNESKTWKSQDALRGSCGASEAFGFYPHDANETTDEVDIEMAFSEEDLK